MNRHHSISIPEAILHSKPAAPAVVTARRSHRESCSGARDQIRCPEQVLGQEPRRAAGGSVPRSLHLPQQVRLAPPHTALPRTGEPAAEDWRGERPSFDPRGQKGQD